MVLPARPRRAPPARAAAQMQLADHEIKAFLDAAPDAMVIVDPEGLVAFVNAQAQALFGYPRDELAGLPAEVLLPERYRERHRAHRAGYAAAPRARPMGENVELYGLRKDGTEFPAEISLSPVQTERGVFVSTAIRDASERKAVEQALKDAREQAERANRAKSGFLAAASHDLRQPLQTLTLLSSVLSRTVPSDSKAASAVASQGEALRAMSRLLNSLLDISRLETGAVTPDVTDCAVREIFTGLRAEFAALAESKGLELLVEDCEDRVRTDPALLGRIVQNLVGNAIRYTREGCVRLRGRAEPETVRIEVLDTGTGIPANELERIFDEFYQTPSSGAAGREGLGLGLSIARRTADLLGHPIEVSSTVGEGSCFAVSVPKASAAGADARGEASSGARGAWSGTGSVLVIDDDTAVADATAMLLDASGFAAVVSDGTGRARELALESPPGLLVCDYHLSGENGIDAIQALREASGRSIPAVLISGDTSASILDAVGSIEDCHLLSKPVDTDELLGLVARLLG